MSAKILIKNIRHLRKLSGSTQESFSGKLGVPRARYGAWEEGRSEPDLDTIIKLARQENITIDELLTIDLSLTKICSNNI